MVAQASACSAGFSRRSRYPPTNYSTPVCPFFCASLNPLTDRTLPGISSRLNRKEASAILLFPPRRREKNPRRKFFFPPPSPPPPPGSFPPPPPFPPPHLKSPPPPPPQKN